MSQVQTGSIKGRNKVFSIRWAATSEHVALDMCAQHSRSLIRVFVGRFAGRQKSKASTCRQRRLFRPDWCACAWDRYAHRSGIWYATHEKGPYAICGQRRPRSACANAQADQGLRCPLTESVDTVVYVDELRLLKAYCTDAHADLDVCYSHMAFLPRRASYVHNLTLRTRAAYRGAKHPRMFCPGPWF